jgi:hypothetical protein
MARTRTSCAGYCGDPVGDEQIDQVSTGEVVAVSLGRSERPARIANLAWRKINTGACTQAGR